MPKLEKVPILIGTLALVITLPMVVFLTTRKEPTALRTRAGVEQESLLYLWPAQVTTTLETNGSFQIDVTLNTQGQESGGVDIVISFDPDILELVDNTIEPGIIFGNYFGRQVDHRKGIVQISATGQFSGQGRVAGLSFRPLKRGETAVDLVFKTGGAQECAVWDTTEKKDLLKAVNGTIITVN
ncbi:cohesin domain-containing protein [Candidatus Parcubacteria bacterium]|nr:cohesin domain-containing protein [Candidatus Parcubacteria bacterium]